MDTLAQRNNNPGNLKDPSTGQFRQFGSPQEGYAALMNDLEGKKTGRTVTGLGPKSTLADFAKVYAPASDKNNPAQYAANIANHMKVRPDATIGSLDTGRWAEAVAHSEGYPVSPRSEQKPDTTVVAQEETKIPEEEYKPWFKAEESDGAVTAGLKALGNTIPSAINFGKGVLDSVNPYNAYKNIMAIPEAYREAKAANQGSVAATLGNTIGSVPGEAYKALVPKVGQQLISGDIAGASKTMTEDPFGQTAPFVFATQGGAKLADNIASKSAMEGYVNKIGENTKNRVPIPKPTTTYSDTFGKGVETLAKPVTKTAGVLGEKVGNVAGGVGASLASHLTGLDPQTIKQVLSNPESFSKIERDNASRGGLAGEIQGAIEKRLEDLKETGKGYEAVKNSTQIIDVPEGFIEESLANHGLKISKGKVVSDTNSITRNASDLRAIQDFYKNWGKKKQLTPNEFLNMRSDLAELSKFDKITGMGKTRASETVGKSLYERANRNIRDKQIEELKALDETYAPEREFLQQVKKDYFNSDGTFKDNAPSRIANAGNKAELLKRLEKVMPGVTKRISILKAVEDIQKASGIKVGSYGRLVAGGLGFASGGIPGALLAEILTSPELAVPILRKAGYVGSKMIPVINRLKIIAGDIGQPVGIPSGLFSGMLAGRASQNP